MGWVKGSKQLTRTIVGDVLDKASGDIKSQIPLAQRLTDGTYMALGVYDTGLSMDSTKVEMKELKKSIRVRWSISLTKVPYAPMWYNGWGNNAAYGRRPVLEVAAFAWAQDIGLGLSASKASSDKRSLSYGSQFE
jgi:hypothetical protein